MLAAGIGREGNHRIPQGFAAPTLSTSNPKAEFDADT
jgi:hypothetical protein